MNQMKYSAYALLLVLGIASVALFINNLSFPSHSSPTFSETKKETTTAETVKNLAGQNLFRNNCASCHALNKTLTGPALAGVESRGPWIDRKNVIRWVNNPSVIIGENAFAKNLVSQFNGQIMPAFPQLSEQQIGSILDYIKEAQP